MFSSDFLFLNRKNIEKESIDEKYKIKFIQLKFIFPWNGLCGIKPSLM